MPDAVMFNGLFCDSLIRPNSYRIVGGRRLSVVKMARAH
jgi:hypothetical protein